MTEVLLVTLDPLLLTLVGGLLALDGTSLGQFMVSRPIVAGVLAGWILGDPMLGLLVGGTLELYFIPVFPVGGADFPEGGPTTLVGVTAATLLPGVEGLAFGVMMGLLWSRLAGLSIHLLRRANAHLVPDPSRGQVTPKGIFWGHLAAIGLDFLRGALLTISGVAVSIYAAQLLEGSWPLSQTTTMGILLVGLSVPIGAFIRSLGGWRKRGVLFVAGLLGFLIGSYLL
jgi:mannose/fructose/N-acetylgalactosamine-specific phosphotransferase system component IIC